MNYNKAYNFTIGDCWLKDKILTGDEPTRDDMNGNRCTTYFVALNG